MPVRLRGVIWKVGEKTLEREHALGDALAVVEPVNTDDHGAAGEALQHLTDEMRFNGAAGEPRERLGLNADRKGADPHHTIAKVEAIAACPRQPALVGDVAREIGGIDLGLKSDQIVVAQRGYELIVIWQRSENFRWREWNMDEEADLVAVTAIAQRLG